jgi:hypothetical protein
MLQIIPAAQRQPSLGERLSQGLGRGLEMGQQLYDKHLQEERLKEENAAFQNLTGRDIAGIRDPKMRQEIAALSLQGQNQASKSAAELASNKKIIAGIEKERGLEPGSLSAYESDPKMAEQISRPAKERTRRLSEMPIDPEQKDALNSARSTPGFDDMDEVDQYRIMVDKGVSPELAEKESKLTSSKLERSQKGLESSYEAQKDFINKTTDTYKAFETEMKPRLLQMQRIPPEEVIGPTAAAFLETLGIPLGALEDPSSELYQKLSLDLLKGLPETYGNRIMKVEVDNFLKTIPSLLNSVEGRRMIASNMLKLGEMKEVYYNEMRKQQIDALDKNKPLPRDFKQSVFDQ